MQLYYLSLYFSQICDVLSLQTMLTRSVQEPGGPCTKSMEVAESRMERVELCQSHYKTSSYQHHIHVQCLVNPLKTSPEYTGCPRKSGTVDFQYNTS